MKDGKYEEALERARQGLPIDKIFPELNESEDERIRKELVYFIQKEKEYMESEVKPENSPRLMFLMDALAYLERQKEPLTPEEKMNHPLYLEGFDVGKKVGEVLKEQKPAERRRRIYCAHSVIYRQLTTKTTFAKQSILPTNLSDNSNKNNHAQKECNRTAEEESFSRGCSHQR